MRDARPYTDDEIEEMQEQLGDAVPSMSVAQLVGTLARQVAIRELGQILDPQAWDDAEFECSPEFRIRQRLDELAAWSPGE